MKKGVVKNIQATAYNGTPIVDSILYILYFFLQVIHDQEAMATDAKIQEDQQCENTWCKCGGVIRTPYSAETQPGGPV